MPHGAISPGLRIGRSIRTIHLLGSTYYKNLTNSAIFKYPILYTKNVRDPSWFDDVKSPSEKTNLIFAFQQPFRVQHGVNQVAKIASM